MLSGHDLEDYDAGASHPAPEPAASSGPRQVHPAAFALFAADAAIAVAMAANRLFVAAACRPWLAGTGR